MRMMNALAAGCLLAVASLLGAPALAGDPCGGLDLSGGVAKTEHALAAEIDLDEGSTACLGFVAEQLAGRPGLRTVTVTVKVPDDLRASGIGGEVKDAYVEQLVAGGLPAGRVSGVVAAGDAPGAVHISFAERRSTAEVGAIEAASGEVGAGGTPQTITGIGAGSVITAGTWVITGEDGRAVLALADRSRVRVRPTTEIQIGGVHLDENLQRKVDLEVVRGGVDAAVEPGGEGATFRIRTPYGSAGVRGTTFRLSTDEHTTRLETLTGTVDLEGSAGTVQVEANHGASVGESGEPTAARVLPDAPRIKSPLSGALPAKGLRWAKVDGAVAYRVEVARDAEFAIDVATTSVEARAWAPELATGQWFWRVAALDDEGYLGDWSKVYAFAVPE